MSTTARRPSRTQLDEAVHQKIRDVIAPGLKILFCGINPGRYSAAVGHHFATPSNRFWPTIHAAGFTPRRLSPFEDAELLKLNLGITNLVNRTTARADVLTKQELLEGAEVLRRQVRRLRPKILAVVGLGAYRTALEDPKAVCGLQVGTIGSTHVWLLPNPSGRNAHHQGAKLVALFRALHDFAVGLELREPDC